MEPTKPVLNQISTSAPVDKRQTPCAIMTTQNLKLKIYFSPVAFVPTHLRVDSAKRTKTAAKTQTRHVFLEPNVPIKKRHSVVIIVDSAHRDIPEMGLNVLRILRRRHKTKFVSIFRKLNTDVWSEMMGQMPIADWLLEKYYSISVMMDTK